MPSGERLAALTRTFLSTPTPSGEEASGAIHESIEHLGPYSDENLASRSLSWKEEPLYSRSTQCCGCRRRDWRRAHAGGSLAADGAIVIDARCLQDRRFASRGVGRHAATVLDAVRSAAPDSALIALTSPELPEFEPTVDVFHAIRSTPPTDVSETALFVQLSPMTASCTAAIPFLASPSCRTVAIVYDFIPSRFPAAYLTSCVDALENRARLEALRWFDVILPISNATLNDARTFLGDAPRPTSPGSPIPWTASSRACRTCPTFFSSLRVAMLGRTPPRPSLRSLRRVRKREGSRSS